MFEIHPTTRSVAVPPLSVAPVAGPAAEAVAP
ncbi:hypothetical protein TUE45_pSRTUE45a_0058 (plasmid) [Streptomyces reticuli]|nr:hypothetical protein TUE45_pSRTUE45a_0058 [Streptomyces reticuli]